MTAYETIPNDDEAPKKQKSFKGLIRSTGWTWAKWSATKEAASTQGHINCYSTGYDPDTIGEMNLAECFVDCSSDTKCHGVVLEWTNNGLAKCYKRGKIDPTKCDSGDASFTTYSISQ